MIGRRGFSRVILRSVVHNNRGGHELPPGVTEKNIHGVWLLLDEKAYEKQGLIHFKTAFLEDRMHDWRIAGTKLVWYGMGQPGDCCDLVIVYNPQTELKRSR